MVPRRPKNGSTPHLKRILRYLISACSRGRAKLPPSGFQEAPKRRPRGPKGPPRGAKRPPRGAQEAPKRPPRRLPEAPKRHTRCHICFKFLGVFDVSHLDLILGFYTNKEGTFTRIEGKTFHENGELHTNKKVEFKCIRSDTLYE